MREKKFSKSRVLALVLAFAMVVTALPFAGFDAKAADENNSVTVYRAYNTQTNDHLFTADENEYKTTIANPIWNDEGRAWSAPKESTTPIYRAYNTSNGEHLYTADAGEYASLPGGWNKEGTLLYSDDAMGKPVYRLFCAEWDLHLYTADENEMAVLLASGSWTADFGGEAAYYALADQSAEVSLVDVNGLQEDGTALESDTLKIVFGSNFGTPKTVAWYKDGSIVKVSSTQLGTADFELNPLKEVKTYTSGEYYAVITNQDGTPFTTNSIIVGEAAEGVIDNFTLANNLSALMAHAESYTERVKAGNYAAAAAVSEMVEIDQETHNVVVSFDLNKNYDGYLYLVDAESTTLTVADEATELKLSDAKTNGIIKAVEKASKVTDANLWDETYYTTAGSEADVKVAKGIYYVNDDGSVNYKLQNEAFGELERGKSYVLVLSDDKLNVGDDLDDVNATEAVECPYVIAPDSIDITSAAAGTMKQGWDVQISANWLGMDASWINTVDVAKTRATGFTAPVGTDNAKVIMYQNTVSKNTGGSPVVNGLPGGTLMNEDNTTGQMIRVAIGGQSPVAKKAATAAAGKAVYAEFTADPGIFGPDEVKLVSSAVEFTTDPADKWTATWEGEDVTVDIEGLSSAASGTLYLFNGTKDVNTYDKIAGQDELKKLDAIEIDGATEQVVFERVLNQSQLSGMKTKSSASFSVVFVPDDTSRFAEVNKNGENSAKVVDMNFTIRNMPTTFAISSAKTGVKTGDSISLNFYNQFGSSMDAAAIGDQKNIKEFNSGNGTSTQQDIFLDDQGDGTFKIGGIAGALGGLAQDDVYKIQLGKKQLFVLKVENLAGNDTTFKISIEDIV